MNYITLIKRVLNKSSVSNPLNKCRFKGNMFNTSRRYHSNHIRKRWIQYPTKIHVQENADESN